MGQPNRDEVLVSAWICGLLLYTTEPISSSSMPHPSLRARHNVVPFLRPGQYSDHTLPKTPGPYRMGLGCTVQLYHVALQVLLLHELL